jgi:hypothetical protein
MNKHLVNLLGETSFFKTLAEDAKCTLDELPEYPRVIYNKLELWYNQIISTKQYHVLQLNLEQVNYICSDSITEEILSIDQKEEILHYSITTKNKPFIRFILNNLHYDVTSKLRILLHLSIYKFNDIADEIKFNSDEIITNNHILSTILLQEKIAGTSYIRERFLVNKKDIPNLSIKYFKTEGTGSRILKILITENREYLKKIYTAADFKEKALLKSCILNTIPRFCEIPRLDFILFMVEELKIFAMPAFYACIKNKCESNLYPQMKDKPDINPINNLIDELLDNKILLDPITNIVGFIDNRDVIYKLINHNEEYIADILEKTSIDFSKDKDLFNLIIAKFNMQNMSILHIQEILMNYTLLTSENKVKVREKLNKVHIQRISDAFVNILVNHTINKAELTRIKAIYKVFKQKISVSRIHNAVHSVEKKLRELAEYTMNYENINNLIELLKFMLFV